MLSYFSKRRASSSSKIIWFFVCASFIITSACFYLPKATEKSYASALPYMPEPAQIITTSSHINLPMLKGMQFYQDDPFTFNFIIDQGDKDLGEEAFKAESNRIIKYFLSSLTIPEEDLWVNLSPYEEDIIIPDGLGATDMGKDLLGEDYVLKQLLASLTYPESPLGKLFWKEVYRRAFILFGTTDIPINTFNKIWIVPEKAVIFEEKDKALISQAKLKVMLEEDYFALEENIDDPQYRLDKVNEQKVKDANSLSSQIIKTMVLPVIEKEINNGENFALLRQVYHSLVLAIWFKQKLRESILEKVYVNKNKIKGIELNDPEIKEKIYRQYLKAYTDGAYKYVKKEYDQAEKKHVRRMYYSGGMDFTAITKPATFVNTMPISMTQTNISFPTSTTQEISGFSQRQAQTASPLQFVPANVTEKIKELIKPQTKFQAIEDTAKNQFDSSLRQVKFRIKPFSTSSTPIAQRKSTINFNNVLSRDFGRSRTSNNYGWAKMGEDLVNIFSNVDLQKQKVVAAQVSIQNFKGEFNDRGAKLNELASVEIIADDGTLFRSKVDVAGHEFGDFGIQAVAAELKNAMQKRLSSQGINFEIYNEAKDFMFVFDNAPKSFDANKVFNDVLNDGNLKRKVVNRVKRRILEKANQNYQQKISESSDTKIKEELRKNLAKVTAEIEKFNSQNFNMYAGIVEASPSQDPLAAADQFISQIGETAKYAQIKLDDNTFDDAKKSLSSADEISKTLLKEKLKQTIESSKSAPRSRVVVFNQDVARRIEDEKRIHQEILRDVGEYQQFNLPSQNYDPARTYDNLKKQFHTAVLINDETRLKMVKQEILEKMTVYPMRQEAKMAGQITIFEGNERFKNTINYLSENPLENNWAATFKIGGDEAAKLEWNADSRKIKVYRFDINNLGRINAQLGAKIGDRIIDDTLLIVDQNPAAQSMQIVYDYFRNQSKDGNFSDNPLELTEREYNHIASKIDEMAQFKGKDIKYKEFLTVKNIQGEKKYFLHKIPEVKVEDKVHNAVYYSPVAVSAGVVDIDQKFIRDNYQGRGRNISVIQGRADNAAENVKTLIKDYQRTHDGIIDRSVFEKAVVSMRAPPMVDSSLSMDQRKMQVQRVMKSFNEIVAAPAEKELTSFIINKKLQEIKNRGQNLFASSPLPLDIQKQAENLVKQANLPREYEWMYKRHIPTDFSNISGYVNKENFLTDLKGQIRLAKIITSKDTVMEMAEFKPSESKALILDAFDLAEDSISQMPERGGAKIAFETGNFVIRVHDTVPLSALRKRLAGQSEAVASKIINNDKLVAKIEDVAGYPMDTVEKVIPLDIVQNQAQAKNDFELVEMLNKAKMANPIIASGIMDPRDENTKKGKNMGIALREDNNKLQAYVVAFDLDGVPEYIEKHGVKEVKAMVSSAKPLALDVSRLEKVVPDIRKQLSTEFNPGQYLKSLASSAISPVLFTKAHTELEKAQLKDMRKKFNQQFGRWTDNKAKQKATATINEIQKILQQKVVNKDEVDFESFTKTLIHHDNTFAELKNIAIVGQKRGEISLPESDVFEEHKVKFDFGSDSNEWISKIENLKTELAQITQWDFVNRFPQAVGMNLMRVPFDDEDSFIGQEGKRIQINQSRYFSHVPTYIEKNILTPDKPVVLTTVPVSSMKMSSWIEDKNKKHYEPEVLVKGKVEVQDVFYLDQVDDFISEDMRRYSQTRRAYNDALQKMEQIDFRDKEIAVINTEFASSAIGSKLTQRLSPNIAGKIMQPTRYNKFWKNLIAVGGLGKLNTEHTIRNSRAVSYFSNQEKLTVDQEKSLGIGLWLHDISKDSPLQEYIPENSQLSGNLRLLVHHFEGAEVAEELLNKAVDESKNKGKLIKEVKDIILTHMGPNKGSIPFGDEKLGFMELTRKIRLPQAKEELLRIKSDIKKGVNRSISLERVDVLLGYVDNLEKGFQEPKTKVEKIARDIDLLDLAIDGVVKVVALRQTDPAFTAKPETIRTSFESSMQSAVDVGQNLTTKTAKDIHGQLINRLKGFTKFMDKRSRFQKIQKMKTPLQQIKAFEKEYKTYIRQNKLKYDDVLSGKKYASSALEKNISNLKKEIVSLASAASPLNMDNQQAVRVAEKLKTVVVETKTIYKRATEQSLATNDKLKNIIGDNEILNTASTRAIRERSFKIEDLDTLEKEFSQVKDAQQLKAVFDKYSVKPTVEQKAVLDMLEQEVAGFRRDNIFFVDRTTNFGRTFYLDTDDANFYGIDSDGFSRQGVVFINHDKTDPIALMELAIHEDMHKYGKINKAKVQYPALASFVSEGITTYLQKDTILNMLKKDSPAVLKVKDFIDSKIDKDVKLLSRMLQQDPVAIVTNRILGYPAQRQFAERLSEKFGKDFVVDMYTKGDLSLLEQKIGTKRFKAIADILERNEDDLAISANRISYDTISLILENQTSMLEKTRNFSAREIDDMVEATAIITSTIDNHEELFKADPVILPQFYKIISRDVVGRGLVEEYSVGKNLNRKKIETEISNMVEETLKFLDADIQEPPLPVSSSPAKRNMQRHMKGGIDFNPKHIDIEVEGRSQIMPNFDISEEILKNFKGFSFEIMQISPIDKNQEVFTLR